jgi:hypothetical protein
VAERIFSSDRMIGFWRLHSYKDICIRLKQLNAFFEKHMGESLEQSIELLNKLESKDLKHIESRMESINLNDKPSGFKTKKRSNSASSSK